MKLRHVWLLRGAVIAPLCPEGAYHSDRGEYLLTLRFMPDGTKQVLDGGGALTRAIFECARAIREGRPTSESQRGIARPVSGGWNGARSRFALSGLVTCACCGSRYQGVRRTKGVPRKDGSRVYSYSYGCGGYIARGTSVCGFNAVPQVEFEAAVIEAILEYYRRYQSEAGRQMLTRTALKHVGTKAKDLSEARRWIEAESSRIDGAIRNLLDSLRPATRDLIEERLAELRKERERLELRKGELDRLVAQQGEVQEIVHDMTRFLSGLEWSLRQGVPEERLMALRRCLEGVVVDKPGRTAGLRIRPLPSPALAGVPAEAVTIPLPAATCALRAAPQA